MGRTIFAYTRHHTSLALYSTSNHGPRPREPSSSTITAAELAAQVAAMGRRMDAEAEQREKERKEEAEQREKERKEERERAERSEAIMAQLLAALVCIPPSSLSAFLSLSL